MTYRNIGGNRYEKIYEQARQNMMQQRPVKGSRHDLEQAVNEKYGDVECEAAESNNEHNIRKRNELPMKQQTAQIADHPHNEHVYAEHMPVIQHVVQQAEQQPQHHRV